MNFILLYAQKFKIYTKFYSINKTLFSVFCIKFKEQKINMSGQKVSEKM